LDWYHKAAEQGHAGAQFNLGLIYDRGLGVKQDSAQALEWFRKAAGQGNAGAQFNLGVMYARGVGVKQDSAQALDWYHKAAEQGHADAQFNLGLMYQRVLGVNEDQAQAVVWYLKAAKQGHADAQCNLGCMYELGRGVEQDSAQAVYWYRKAAEQGHPGAQFNLGTMYQLGEAVKKDDSQAMDWYGKAAKQGYADAQFKIGEIYAKGKGVEADDVQAFNWYFKAAKNGSKDAQLKLATHYQQGRGVEKDVLQATYWFLKSTKEDECEEIVLNVDEVAEHFYSDVIRCIPAALTTFPEFKNIKAINFKLIVLLDQDFLSIGQMIRANAHLEILNLELQELDDAQALILSEALAFNTTLTEIIFDDEYGFDINIFNQIKASLAQNVIIAKLRERLKGHLITGPDGLPKRVPYITRSDELPLEILEIIVDNMTVKASKVGKDNKVIIAGIDEFLLSVSRETLKNDLKKSS
jgi:TPR repeat protein